MSVLIKGMEMPDSCGDCPLRTSNWGKDWCVATEDDGELPYDFYKHSHVRQEWCPLEEVPDAIYMKNVDKLKNNFSETLKKTTGLDPL